jgi:Domain of unknown function (DUF4386)/Domain of unknown function (DUF5753)
VLHRAISEPKVMHDQLMQVAEMSERPKMSIQVIPFTAGARTGLLGAFVIATLDGDGSKRVLGDRDHRPGSGLRTLEAAVIAIGVVSLLAVVTLRQQAGVDAAALVGVGKSLVAVHNWTFLFGPNFVCAADTFVLAWLMWRSRLIPRFIAGLGVVGGPLLFVSATAVLFGAFKQVSLPGAIAPLPVFAWELGLAFFLILKGFKVTGLDQRETPRISEPVAIPA